MTSPTLGPTRQSWVPLVVLATGVSMVVIDATIVNVAVPAILADLRLGATDVEWINSVYSLMFAALLIPFGRMGDLYGRRRLFALGVAVFLLASVLAAVSVNGPMLIAVRAVQGVGAAMAVPMTLAIINQIYTGRQRVIAFAVWGSIIGGMAAAARWRGLARHRTRLACGVLDQSADRRAAPARLAARARLAGRARCGHRSRRARPRRARHDRRGLRADRGPEVRLVRAAADRRPLRPAVRERLPVPFAFGVGILALVALIVRERRRERAGLPVLVDLTLFELPSFRYGSMTAVIVALGEFGMILVLPLFLQSALGYTAFRAGLVIAALALGTFLAGGLVPPLSKTLSPRAIVRIGLALEAVGAAGIGLSLAPDMGAWRPVPWLLLYGAGIGFATAQLTGVLMADVPSRLSGGASALQSTVRQLGAALGVAILGGVLVSGLGSAVERGLSDRPQQVRTSVARAVEESAGAAIPALRDPAIHAAAVEAAAEATRRVTFITALALLAGVGITLLLPRTPVGRDESPEQVAAGGPDTGGREPDM